MSFLEALDILLGSKLLHDGRETVYSVCQVFDVIKFELIKLGSGWCTGTDDRLDHAFKHDRDRRSIGGRHDPD